MASLVRYKSHPNQFLTVPSGVKRRIYNKSAKREFSVGVGWGGWVGWTGYQTCPSFPSIFFILYGYIDKVYVSVYVIKNYHEHYYGFQNLMLTWEVGILFSKITL